MSDNLIAQLNIPQERKLHIDELISFNFGTGKILKIAHVAIAELVFQVSLFLKIQAVYLYSYFA